MVQDEEAEEQMQMEHMVCCARMDYVHFAEMVVCMEFVELGAADEMMARMAMKPVSAEE